MPIDKETNLLKKMFKNTQKNLRKTKIQFQKKKRKRNLKHNQKNYAKFFYFQSVH